MSEWLRSLTRNQIGSACVGSNPTAVVFASSLEIFLARFFMLAQRLSRLRCLQDQIFRFFPRYRSIRTAALLERFPLENESRDGTYPSDSASPSRDSSTISQIGRGFDKANVDVEAKLSSAAISANRLAAKIRTGQIDPCIAIQTVQDLLLSLSDNDLQAMRCLDISKAMRAWTVLPVTENNVEYLNQVLEEASRRARIEAFSAMDISEILHSCSTIAGNIPDSAIFQAVRSSLCQAAQDILGEFLSRAQYITVKIVSVGREDKQWLSIQALSNILFASRQLRKWNPACISQSPHEDLTSALISLILNHCDKSAINSCQAFHCVAMIEGIIESTSTPSPTEVKCVTRLLNEVVRKKETIRIPELSRVLMDLEVRWKDMDKQSRLIPSLVASKFHP